MTLVSAAGAHKDGTGPQDYTGFLALPGEVRNTIYDFVVATLPTPYTASPQSLKQTSSLAKANKRIRKEYNSFVARYSCHKICTTKSLWRLDDMLFSSASSETSRGMITAVVFPHFTGMATSPSRANEIMDFCKALPSLKCLTLNFNLDYLQAPYLHYYHDNQQISDELQVNNSWAPALSPAQLAKTVSRVAENFALCQIVDLLSLRRITLECKPETAGLDPTAVTVFRELRPWLEKELLTMPGARKPIVNCRFDVATRSRIAFCLDIESV